LTPILHDDLFWIEFCWMRLLLLEQKCATPRRLPTFFAKVS